MTANLILGIDPGLDGALAFVDLHTGALADVFDVPTLQLKNKRELDEYRLGGLIDEHAARIVDAWIESAWPRPGEANTLSFAFGRNYGQLRGVVAANFIPLHDASPAGWKRSMGVTGDKDESRKAASIMWPAEAGRWPAKKHHGRAEACLIAAYGRRKFLELHSIELEAANG
jgi:crossover junction endodeoxyribonuclease RuvC